MSEPTTPLMQQYNAVKTRYPHALLLFRLGDFYELFYEDAIIASRELQITLTSRNREKGQPIPMCGVPYHAADSYIARLIRAGFKVAICEQMEQPGPGKKLVRREVTRVITPGTATDVAVLDARENNFLAAVAQSPRDISTRGDDAPSIEALRHLDRIRFYEQHDALVLDPVSVRNLELISPIFTEESKSSGPTTLISALDSTVTGMGARMLRAWMLRPLIDLDAIAARLGAVAHLLQQTVVRGEIRKELRGIQDLERLTSRITLGLATPRELLALRKSLAQLPVLKNFLTPPQSGGSDLLRDLHEEIDELTDVREKLEKSLSDEPPASAAEPGMIRSGYHAELDDLRDTSKNSKQIIAAMEERERKRTGIGSLKIRFNQIFGYYIEISRPNLPNAPADYERKQTLVNAERFTSPELKDYERKILAADERILEIERQLFVDVRSGIAAKAARLRITAAAVAKLDVLASFAKIAADRTYIRPAFNNAGELLIVGGRHPVIEELLRQKGERFVANDLCFEPGRQQLLLITGPNMGGKSTYLRQAALIVLLAQIGSFVPARQAKLPITDRIFTRIGASDNLARGRSTFLVEMSEVASILNHATPSSLVLLDEVGRGTATFDGLSIAWAVVEHLQKHTRARTLFATHYHELTELGDLLPAVKNVHVSVKETPSEIIFLRRVEPGSADKSYGIEVARLAGLPRS